MNTGDKGQRYVVYCNRGGWSILVGYTDRADGRPFVGMIEKHPAWTDPSIKDRGEPKK